MRPIADFEALAAPGPTTTALTQPFWDAAAERRLLIQRCADCGRWVFYPRAICPHCWSDRLDWAEVSGRGALETWSTVFRPGHPAWEPVAPYTVGLVRLAEGATLLTHVLVEPAAPRLGLALEVRFVRVAGYSLPFFEPSR